MRVPAQNTSGGSGPQQSSGSGFSPQQSSGNGFNPQQSSGGGFSPRHHSRGHNYQQVSGSHTSQPYEGQYGVHRDGRARTLEIHSALGYDNIVLAPVLGDGNANNAVENQSGPAAPTMPAGAIRPVTQADLDAMHAAARAAMVAHPAGETESTVTLYEDNGNSTHPAVGNNQSNARPVANNQSNGPLVVSSQSNARNYRKDQEVGHETIVGSLPNKSLITIGTMNGHITLKSEESTVKVGTTIRSPCFNGVFQVATNLLGTVAMAKANGTLPSDLAQFLRDSGAGVALWIREVVEDGRGGSTVEYPGTNAGMWRFEATARPVQDLNPHQLRTLLGRANEELWKYSVSDMGNHQPLPSQQQQDAGSGSGVAMGHHHAHPDPAEWYAGARPINIGIRSNNLAVIQPGQPRRTPLEYDWERIEWNR